MTKFEELTSEFITKMGSCLRKDDKEAIDYMLSANQYISEKDSIILFENNFCDIETLKKLNLHY